VLERKLGSNHPYPLGFFQVRLNSFEDGIELDLGEIEVEPFGLNPLQSSPTCS